MDIYVDLDMVLVPLLDTWIECINKKQGTDYTTDNIERYADDILINNFDVLKDGSIYEKLSPFEGASYFLDELKSLGNVKILSNSIGAKNDEAKREFCKKYFPEVERIIKGGDKHLIVKHNILIDDFFGSIYNVVKHSKGHGILFNMKNKYKYNDMLLTDFNFHRANSYDGVYNIIYNIRDF